MSEPQVHVSASAAVARAIDQERRRIGDELHDGVCQTLGGAQLLAEMLGRAVSAGKTPSLEQIGQLREALLKSIQDLRALSSRLSPANLSGPGLMTALQNLALETGAEFTCEQAVFLSDPGVAAAFFRIAQEAAREEHARIHLLRDAMVVSAPALRFGAVAPWAASVGAAITPVAGGFACRFPTQPLPEASRDTTGEKA